MQAIAPYHLTRSRAAWHRIYTVYGATDRSLSLLLPQFLGDEVNGVIAFTGKRIDRLWEITFCAFASLVRDVAGTARGTVRRPTPLVAERRAHTCMTRSRCVASFRTFMTRQIAACTDILRSYNISKEGEPRGKKDERKRHAKHDS